jgi:hypothetical protein
MADTGCLIREKKLKHQTEPEGNLTLAGSYPRAKPATCVNRIGMDGTSNVSRTDESMADKSVNERGLDPMGIANPVSARFFQSDGAQDEISGTNRKKMKCRSCGQIFTGDNYDICPECFSPGTEEIADEKDDGYW